MLQQHQQKQLAFSKKGKPPPNPSRNRLRYTPKKTTTRNIESAYTQSCRAAGQTDIRGLSRNRPNQNIPPSALGPDQIKISPPRRSDLSSSPRTRTAPVHVAVSADDNGDSNNSNTYKQQPKQERNNDKKATQRRQNSSNNKTTKTSPPTLSLIHI